MAALVQASFGGLRIFVSSAGRAVGRTVAVHSPAQGSGFVVQDRGDELGRIDWELWFCPVPGERDHRARYQEFLDLAAKGPQTLIHPIRGSLRVQVGGALETIEGPDLIRLQVEFLPTGPAVSVTAPGGGVVPVGGSQATAVRAAELSSDLSAVGLSSTVGATAVTKTEGWAEGDADARTVLLEMASTAAEIDQLITTHALLEDLELWAAFRSAMLLRDSIRGAAQAATQAVAQLMELVVTAAVPLRVLCARVHGAAKADEITEETARLNDFGARALVPAGTRLRMRAPGAGARR